MEKEMPDEKAGWNRDMIKMIAMVTMTLNHIAAVFLQSGTLSYEVLTDIGYFTAITMCYFLVEGYAYTRSKKKYACRLLVFAMISQLPYNFAFSDHGIMDFQQGNMMVTLFFCFLIIYAKKEEMNESSRRNLLLLSVVATMFCDWPVYAAVFTLLFLWADNSKERKRQAFLLSMFSFGIICFINALTTYSLEKALFLSGGSMIGIGLSGVCLLCFYNGRRAKRGNIFLKWFFYLYYPVHLLILGMIRWL